MTRSAPLPFGELLRRYRQAAALSQGALAERAGLSAQAISMLERGRRTAPHPETITLLAGAPGLTPEQQAALVAATQPGEPAMATAAPTDSPVAGGAARTPAPPGLPTPATPLVGRQDEVAAVVALLGRPATRLRTLTGTGGVGKTRLALAVAATHGQRYADGIWLVELGVREEPDTRLPHTLAAYLRDRQILLLPDNCEHLIGACAGLCGALLRACASWPPAARRWRSWASSATGCPRCPCPTWRICPHRSG